jgi:hypothetical protein
MTFVTNYEAIAGETLRIDVEGCHGTLQIEREIPESVDVVVSPPKVDGDVMSLAWTTDMTADEVEVLVGTGSEDLRCRVADSGALQVPALPASPALLTVDRRFAVGGLESGTADIVFFESAYGTWSP